MKKILFATLVFLSFLSASSCKKEPTDPFDISIEILSNPVIGGEDFNFRIKSTHAFYIQDLTGGYNIPEWKDVLQTPASGYVNFQCKNPEVDETTRETLWMKVISAKTGEYKRIQADYVCYKAFSFEFVSYPAYVQDGTDFIVAIRSTQETIKVGSIQCDYAFDNLKAGKTYRLEPSEDPSDRFYYGEFTAPQVKVTEFRNDCKFSLALANSDGTLYDERGFTYARNTKFFVSATAPGSVSMSDKNRIVVPVALKSNRGKLLLSALSCDIPGLTGCTFEKGYRAGDVIALSDGETSENIILTGNFNDGSKGTLSLRLLDNEDPRGNEDKVGENFSIEFVTTTSGPTPPSDATKIDISLGGGQSLPQPLTLDIYDAADIDAGASVQIRFEADGDCSGFIISQSSDSLDDKGEVDLYVNGQKQTMPYIYTGGRGGSVELRGSKGGEVTVTVASKDNTEVRKSFKIYVRHRLALVLTGSFTREGINTYDTWAGWYGVPESFRVYLSEYDSDLVDLKKLADAKTVHPGDLIDVPMPAYNAKNLQGSFNIQVIHKSTYYLDRERYYLNGNNPGAMYEGIAGQKYYYFSEKYGNISMIQSPMTFGTVAMSKTNSYSWDENDDSSLLYKLRLIDDEMTYIYKRLIGTEPIKHNADWEYFYIDVSMKSYDNSKCNVKYIVHLYKAPISGERPYWYACDNQPAVMKTK